MRETSLDEFVGGDDAASDAGETGEPDRGDVGASEQPTHDDESQQSVATAKASGVDAADADADPHDVDAPPDKPVSTFVWSADGAACARCGAAATRRWRDDRKLVCPSCKKW